MRSSTGKVNARRIEMAAVSNNAETEETVACLHMTFYHPNSYNQMIFQSIPLGLSQEITSDTTVAFGRDLNICKYVFLCKKASRVQFVIHMFKPFHSDQMAFEIKNMSKIKLYVDHLELDCLNKIELPVKCMIRFGEFQILVQKESGESKKFFQISCNFSREPLVQEAPGRVMLSIPEHGMLNGSAQPTLLKCSIAEETDENQL
uniref:TRAF-interacting protein with FHA domain-containing protein A n=1 Tax=Leptobrachium leishanense TaxID=445787 RepID=A0A8C5M3Q4_9ANUR